MGAYAMFALKYPSLLSFEQQTKSEEQNLKTIFGIDQLISGAQMCQALDEVIRMNYKIYLPINFHY